MEEEEARPSTDGETIASFTAAFSKLRESQQKHSQFLEESELDELKLEDEDE
jgi:hypothetical protein